MTNWDEVEDMGSRVKVPGMYHIRVQDCEDKGGKEYKPAKKKG